MKKLIVVNRTSSGGISMGLSKYGRMTYDLIKSGHLDPQKIQVSETTLELLVCLGDQAVAEEKQKEKVNRN